MAKVGDRLLQPEEGWVRYDDSNELILIYNMYKSISSSYFNSTSSYQYSNNPFSISFRFYGSKLRVIGSRNSAYSRQINIRIDDKEYEFSAYYSTSQTQVILYENLDLGLGYHNIEINRAASGYYHFDAVDVDGELVSLTEEVKSISDLSVGKSIRCNYRASVNEVGIFSGLGKSEGDFINLKGDTTPNGDFYLLCCEIRDGKIKLIADRNIQTGISWDKLNSRGFVVGSSLASAFTEEINDIVPDMSDHLKEGFEISASDFHINDFPWRAFTDNSGVSRDYWYVNNSSTYPHWIQIRMDRPRKVNAIEITPLLISVEPNRYSLKDWILEGSNDGENFEQIVAGTNVNNKNPALYSFDNEKYFSYYRLVVLNSYYSNRAIGLRRLRFYEFSGNTLSGQVRLLTGVGEQGSSSNEWDRFIVNSDLEGAILPGDNGIWNWQGIWSWCQEENLTNKNQRVVRGNSSVKGLAYSLSSNAHGLRPVIIIDSLYVQVRDRYNAVSRGKDLDLVFNVHDIYYRNSKWEYKIFVDGEEVYKSGKFVGSQEATYKVPFKYLSDSVEEKDITVEVESDKGVIAKDTVIAKLVNHPPKIESSLKANELSLNITDEDGDFFSYKIVINGEELDYREVLTSSTRLTKIISSDNYEIGKENILIITAIDSYGEESREVITFIGEYYGLMFSDMAGEFYSTDMGEILKYLLTETMMAGTSSFVHPIKLINKYPFKVENIRLFADAKDLQGVGIQFSEEEVPFIAKKDLTFDVELDYGDEVIFYVRVSSDPTAMGGGVFDIYVKADPV